MNTHGFDPHQSARQDRQQKLREAQAQLAFASEDMRLIEAANAQSRPPRIKEKPRLTDPFAVAGTKKGAKGPSPAELATINANAVQAIVAYVESANGRPTAKTTGETPGETAGAKPVALPWINQLVSYFEYIASRGYQVHESIPETIFNDAEMNRHYGGNRRPEEAQSRLGALLNSNPSLKKTQFFVNVAHRLFVYSEYLRGTEGGSMTSSQIESLVFHNKFKWGAYKPSETTSHIFFLTAGTLAQTSTAVISPRNPEIIDRSYDPMMFLNVPYEGDESRHSYGRDISTGIPSRFFTKPLTVDRLLKKAEGLNPVGNCEGSFH